VTRHLFRIAFRQAVFPACGLILAVAALFVLAMPLDPAGIAPLGLIGLALTSPWAGFVAASQVFARDFKEVHFLFIQALPVSRWRAWTAMTAGALAAGFAALLLAGTLALAILAWLRSVPPIPDVGVGAVALIAVFLVLLAAGSCYGLLFAGSAVYAAGPLLTILLLGVAARLMVGFVFGDVRALDRYVSEMAGPPALPSLGPFLADVGVVTVPLLALFLGLSLLFFARGEFGVAAARIRKVRWLAGGHVAFLVALFAGEALRLRASPWNAAEPPQLSPDGRLVLVTERLAGRPRWARLTILDPGSGAAKGQLGLDGLDSATWLAGNRVAVHLLQTSLLPLFGFRGGVSDHVVVVSAEGGPLGRADFAGERLTLCPGGGARAVAVLGAADRRQAPMVGRVLSVDEAGTSAEVLSAPLDDRAACTAVEGRPVVVFPSLQVPRRAWVLGPVPRELRWVEGAGGPPRVLLGDTMFSGTPSVKQVAERFPVHVRGGGERDVLGYALWEFAERPRWVYALAAAPGTGRAELLGRDPAAGAWRSLGRGFALPGSRVVRHDREACQIFPTSCWTCPDGVWSCPGERDGRPVVTLHDESIGRELEVARGRPGERLEVSLRRPGERGPVYVVVSRLADRGSRTATIAAYRTGEGVLEPGAISPNESLDMFWGLPTADGGFVDLAPDGGAVRRRQPGHPDRRLWPPP